MTAPLPPLGEHVTGPVVQLAAQVKAVLEEDPDKLMVSTSYGAFHVRRVELVYWDGGEAETVGWLTPDEAEGNTFDLWTPGRSS